MAKINRAGQSGSLGDIDIAQSGFRAQINALTDAIRQLGGHAEIGDNAGLVNDPLNAPYVLYVNSQIGDDTFVAGDYSITDDGSLEQKLRRISLQRLECGYTASRPFKTINRAVIEAAIITSRSYLNLDPAPCGDLVSIVLAPGVHVVYNGVGSADQDAWSADFTPTPAQLQQFNDTTAGGLIIPRGASLVSLDLRKTIIRPDFVPAPTDEAADYSNRRAIFRVTGGGYYFGFTFLDKEGVTTSHHLLDCFQYTSQTQLAGFYSKVLGTLGTLAGLGSSYTAPRTGE